jgi:hypothetical protein
MTTHAHWYVRAEITRWVSDDQPGFVECGFADRFGRNWSVVDKVPVLSRANLRSDSPYPQPGFIACQIISRDHDESGRETVEMTTDAPWHIEATDGTTRFEFLTQQLIEDQELATLLPNDDFKR